MIERRNWATRPWGRPATGQADGGASMDQHGLPFLWFLANDEDGDTFQPWATAAGAAVVPCFRSRDEAIALAEAAGKESAFVLGFPLLAVPDLMADLPHRAFLVTAIAGDGSPDGQYLPEPPRAATRATHAA